MSRLLLFLIAIPLLLIIAAVLLLPVLVDKDQVLELAASALQRETGAVLEVAGDVDLTLFPGLGVSLNQVSLEMPEGDQTEISVAALDIGVRLLPLLSGEVQVDGVTLDGLRASLVSAPEQKTIDTAGMSDAELDAFYAARRKAQEEAGQVASGQSVLAAPLALNVGRVKITNSQLEIRDSESGDITAIQVKDLEAGNLNLEGRPATLSLLATLEGEQPIDLSLDSRLRIVQESQTVSLEKTTAEISGLTTQPVTIDVGGDINLPNQVADLQLTIGIDDIRGQGNLRYASFESPAIDANMHFNLLDPALLALAGPEAASKSEGGDPSTGGDTPLPLDALRSVDTRASLQIDRAQMDAHALENLVVELRAVDGIVEINKLTGTLHGGSLDMQATFNGKHNVARLHTRGTLNTLDLATALAAMESRPVLTGKANLNWTLTSRGQTTNQLTAALNGPLQLTTREVVLTDMSLERKLCEAISLANREALTAQFPASSALKDLSADIALSDGRAQLNPLRADLEQVALRGRGEMDLTSREFDIVLTANIASGLGELDPACRVNERYTDLDWPVECRGNVEGEPSDWCRVDTDDILEKLAKKEVQRKISEEAGRLFEKLFK